MTLLPWQLGVVQSRMEERITSFFLYFNFNFFNRTWMLVILLAIDCSYDSFQQVLVLIYESRGSSHGVHCVYKNMKDLGEWKPFSEWFAPVMPIEPPKEEEKKLFKEKQIQICIFFFQKKWSSHLNRYLNRKNRRNDL